MRRLLLKHRNRVLIIGLLLALLYAALAVKLWQEQIRQGAVHQRQISRQSIRRIRIPAPRGKILTSDLHVMADNAPSYDVYLYFEEMRQPRGRSHTITYIENALLRIDAIFDRSRRITAPDLKRHMNTRPGLPFKVADDITPRQMAKIFELAETVKGLGIIPGSKRIYPAGDVGAQVIGYTRPEDPRQAGDRQEYFYYLPDLQGVSGIEKQFDTLPFSDNTVRGLKGYPGFSLVQVDRLGFVYKTLIDEIKPLSGNNVVLTLDWRAQRIAAELLKHLRGAFVLLDADTGAVLALVSAPAFDLQQFSPRITAEAYRKLLFAPGKPLFNRALLGEYTPGSIIKPLVALALLKHGVKPDETVDCDGKTVIGKTASIRCASWRHGGHGRTDLRQALERSCNDYFIEQGMKLKMENLRTVFASAGLGAPTGIGLPERRGQLPARETKKRRTGFRWNQCDTAFLCIGQGYILVTPLQMAVYAAALANGGTLYRPYLLQEIRSPEGIVLYRTAPQINGQLAAAAENLEIVKAGMHLVVNGPEGSGKLAKNPLIDLSGKTGTAELNVQGKRRLNTWFIGFGKSGKTNYAAAILVEDGVSGGRTCAPLIREFFLRYLKRKK
ncbi:MAG: penicillin-binding transpeptidase domain-containing protein [Victivallaceae bacterium]|nr:penicillin-binding transpeptidase domain-containing protein [Victivallaceae bacterium]